jgi:hypothetical protein
MRYIEFRSFLSDVNVYDLKKTFFDLSLHDYFVQKHARHQEECLDVDKTIGWKIVFVGRKVF